MILCSLWLFAFVAGAHAWYDGYELGYIDNVTINGQEFENFDERRIVFYPEDLRDGAVVIRGLLENERKDVPLERLQVQITMDGGENWLPATGNGRWEVRFSPEIERSYDFSLRVVQNSGSPAGARGDATASIVQDGAPELTVVEPDKLCLALGDFTLKVERGAVDAAGVISEARGAIAGLPEILRGKCPALFDENGELSVRLNGLQVDLAQGRVTRGAVTLTPSQPLAFELGPVAMSLSGMTFSVAGARIDGSLSLAGLGLPGADLPLACLQLNSSGFSGEVDLIGAGGGRHIDLVDGDFGFGLDLSRLRVRIDSRLPVADRVKLSGLAGSVRFGPGFGDLSIPDLSLAADGSILWGKNPAAGIAASGHRLVLPGGLFSLGDLGGTLDLEEKALAISGTLVLPPALGSVALAIPAEQPLTLSAARGLSSHGAVTFDPSGLPAMSLEHIPARLSGLAIEIANGAISGRLAGSLVFEQFGHLAIAVAASIDQTGLKELVIDSAALQRSFDLQGFATLTLDQVSSGYRDDRFYVRIDGGITPTHALFADYRRQVELKGLRIFKSGIEFARDMDGWKALDGGTVSINAARLSLAEYGLGVESGQLWFGLKGEAALDDNAVPLTARIFQDGTWKISDFGFDGLTLALGDFSLRTAARVTDGLISGEGFIQAGFLTDYLPDNLKDPLTGELKVRFSQLAVDVAARRVTSGTVAVDFPGNLKVDLGAVQAQLRAVRFGTAGAAADGSLALANIAGIDLPEALSGLNLDPVDIRPAGFQGTLSWQAAGAEAISLPVVTGAYGVALRLTRAELAIDTAGASLSDRVRLTDLDGAIRLGPGYDLREPVSGLRMLADGAITWGVAEIEERAEDIASGFSFTIPGTSFAVKNLAGRLSLAERRVDVWGSLVLPADLGGGAIRLTRDHGLRLSAGGLCTQGAVDVDAGTLDTFRLAGFAADVAALSFGVANNVVSGAVAAELKLAPFDNLPIAVCAALGNGGITELAVAADRLQRAFHIGDFADIHLSQVAGGYEDGGFFIALDGDLTLDHQAVSGLQRSFSFAGLKVFKDALKLADSSPGMRDVPDATVHLNDSLLLSLHRYGMGVTDNRFWIALCGGVTLGGQELTATARVYHDGAFELDQLGGNLLIAIGDFTLRTSFDYSGGRIAEATGSLHLGSLMSSIPDSVKNPFGELPVTLRDLAIDLSDPARPKLRSGAIVFDTPFPLVSDFFHARIEGLEVGAVDGAPYGKVLGGSIAFHQVASLPALDDISLADVGLSADGLNGTLTWRGSRTVPVFEHADYGIDAELTRVAIRFDSSKTGLGDMIRLDAMEGCLVFGSGYAASVSPAIVFAEGAYGFAAGEAAALHLPGTAMQLQAFAGSFDFDAGSVTLGGRLVVPYEGTRIAFAVDGLTVSAAGMAGSVALEHPVAIDGLGFPAVLTRAGLDFSGFGLAGGGLGLDLTLERFFDLQVSAALTIDSSGVSAWSLDASSDAAFTADAGFAEMTVSDLGAGYASGDGLFFSMRTDITMKGGAVLSGLPDDLSLSGLKVFADRVAVDAAEMAGSFNGATASLGGLDLTLTRLGIGYGERFYLLAAGNLGMADLCEAGAEIKLYSDLSFDLNEIDIEFANPAVEFAGLLALYDNDPVYGTGFGADLDVLIAGTLPLAGALQVGSVAGEGGSFAYWRVAMKSGATLPLSPIPLNIYGIGGGIAYHMTVDADMNEVRFAPDASSPLALTALVDLGSQDNGYTYFGKFSLNLEGTRVVLSGDSWFMEGRGASGPAHLAARIELGASPAMVHVAARASLSKELSGMTMFGVDGEVDLLFAENDWHIYFGSAAQRLQVTALEFLTGAGYVQLDSSGIAMGVLYEFDLEGSAWIFYGRLYGGAQVDLAAGIKPFYVDARGKVWVGLEAGVKCCGERYEILNAYAELGGRFKAPPVYIGLHGRLHYSFLYGAISGDWDMTFTMPEHPPAGAADAGIEDVPLVAYASPEDAAQNVARLGSITVRANLPIMEPFRYDDGNWYILCIKDPTQPNNVIDFSDVRAAMQKALVLRKDGESRELVGGRQGSMELNFTPYMELGPGQSYTYATTFQLRRYAPDTGTIGPVVSSEEITNGFTTTSAEICFRERVYQVYPTRGTTPVYGQTPIYLVTKAVFDGYAWSWALAGEQLNFEVLNAAGESIAGRIEGKMLVTDAEQGSRRYVLNFIPDQPLQPVRMVENSAGIKRAALLQADGSYRNPFFADATEATEAGLADGPPVSVAGSPALQAGGRSRSVTQTGRTGRTALAAAAANHSDNPLRAGLASGAGLAAIEAGHAERYSWYWDGEYRIRITNAEGRPQYASKFYLTLAAEGGATPYACSREVIENGVTEPHFHVNFNVDESAYRADVAEGQRTMVVPAIDALWPDFVHSVHGADYPACRFRPPSALDAFEGVIVPPSWDVVDDLLPEQRAYFRRAAMEPCAPLAAQLETIDQRFDRYKAEAFARNPSDDVRSLEFRFHTAAPINWNEVELAVDVAPVFSGEVAAQSCQQVTDALNIPILPGFACQTSLEIFLRNASPAVKKQVERMTHPLTVGPSMRHTFNRQESIVRSQSGSLDHVVELKTSKDNFSGDDLVELINFNRDADAGITLQQFGAARIYSRTLQEQDSALDQSSGEYGLQRDELLYDSGILDAVTPDRLLER